MREKLGCCSRSNPSLQFSSAISVVMMAASTSSEKGLTSRGRGWSMSALAHVFMSGRWVRVQGSMRRLSACCSGGPTPLAFTMSVRTPNVSASVLDGSGSANLIHVEISTKLRISSGLLVPDRRMGGPGIHSTSPWKALRILPPLLARAAA